ncbi:hypothetical protein QN355_20315, partial [Cryobacterium sp. 10S3]|uniref:hypothetical protein n=1 Tax=Cryobacterium sp. 10S3 TaxID=3048582 RepID=UPI002B23ADB4
MWVIAASFGSVHADAPRGIRVPLVYGEGLAVPAVPKEMMSDTSVAELELSIVMPCLKEAETLAICIDKAQGY